MDYFKRVLINLTLIGSLALSSLGILNCSKENPVQPQNKPPTVQIVEGPRGRRTSDIARFRWYGQDEDGEVVGYYIDLNESPPNNYTETDYISYLNLKNRDYTFSVQAIDNDGGLSEIVERSFSVDQKIQDDQTDREGFVNFTTDWGNIIIRVEDEYHHSLSGKNVYFVDRKQPDLLLTSTADTDPDYMVMVEDPEGRFFSALHYFSDALTNLRVTLTEGIDSFDLTEAELPSPKNNEDLEFIATVPASQLYEFYQEHDALFQYKSILEFVAEKTGHSTLVVAVELNEFRDKFIESQTQINEILDYIASIFGQGFDSDALYYDVYSHKTLGILVHDINYTNLCTVKGTATNLSTGQTLEDVVVKCWPYEEVTTDEEGNYVIFKVREGTRRLEAVKEGFEKETKIETIEALTKPPFFKSTWIDFELNPTGSNEDTTPPIVNITTPQNGDEIYADYCYITAEAIDNVGIDYVEFSVSPWGSSDNWMFKRDFTYQYMASLPNYVSKPTPFKITAKAYDLSGNASENSIDVIFLEYPKNKNQEE